MIRSLSLPEDILFEARDHMGPVSVLRGKNNNKYLEFAAQITLRYSDAPKSQLCYVISEINGKKSELHVRSVSEPDYVKFRI